MFKVAIAMDAYKLPVFEMMLKSAGYKYINTGTTVNNFVVLRVETENTEALAEVVDRANAMSSVTVVQ